MEGTSHELLTNKVIEWLAELNPGFALAGHKKEIAEMAREADYLEDVEFVNVNGSRDNPHEKEWNKIDDVAHYSKSGNFFTTFNHFIDIKKGEGIFDDYDGYSYKRGSASAGEYQDAADASDNMWAFIISKLSGMKVDEEVNWWFNDEYVHAPGHEWYANCSPAVEGYSFFRDKGIYPGVIQEAGDRFPKANSAGETGKGIPYSVFMPVDNLARWQYSKYMETLEPAHLGMIMHAIQDASIPHHAAGCLGNWHGKYEKELNDKLNNWAVLKSFKSSAAALYNKWNHSGANPPTHLVPTEYGTVPKNNWPIDMLVTWMALNAFHSYARTYRHFAGGYCFDDKDAKKITVYASAVCMLVLQKASDYMTDK